MILSVAAPHSNHALKYPVLHRLEVLLCFHKFETADSRLISQESDIMLKAGDLIFTGEPFAFCLLTEYRHNRCDFCFKIL